MWRTRFKFKILIAHLRNIFTINLQNQKWNMMRARITEAIPLLPPRFFAFDTNEPIQHRHNQAVVPFEHV